MGIKKFILAGALAFAALSGINIPGLEATKVSAASIETFALFELCLRLFI
ncbi:hypothetical protein [Bacillus wiedmannii]|nr:hypothetical protein [Bacillus wiedmannii]MED3126878.1 hypothetical protein [Bacillus wiedmannii]